MKRHVRNITISLLVGVGALGALGGAPAAYGQSSLSSVSSPAPGQTQQEQRLRSAMARIYDSAGFTVTPTGRATADELLGRALAGQLGFDEYGVYVHTSAFVELWVQRIAHSDVESAIGYYENFDVTEWEYEPGPYGLAVGSDDRYFYVAVALTLS